MSTVLEQASYPEIMTPKNPFVIRGHHLEHFARLVKDNLSPAACALGDKYTLQRIAGNAQTPEFAHIQERLRDYVRDCRGVTWEELFAWEKDQTDVYQEFADLPDDAIVLLTKGMPDALCKVQRRGSHCARRCTGIMYDTDMVSYDGQFLDEFYGKAKEMGLEHLLIESNLQAIFTDSLPEQVSVFFTTAGVVKAVCRESTFTSSKTN